MTDLLEQKKGGGKSEVAFSLFEFLRCRFFE